MELNRVSRGKPYMDDDFPYHLKLLYQNERHYYTIMNWCKDNNIQKLFRHPDNHWFKTEEEAILFKLTWI